MHQIAKLLMRLILINMVLIINPVATAAIQFKHVKGFSIDDGLPSATIYSVVKLPTGQLLLGTDRGVARYNGYTFDIFSKKKGNLVLENASNLFVDAQHNIWIGSWGGGLAIYDQQLKLLHHHSPAAGFPANIQAFYQTDKGTIWVGSADGGLLRFKDSVAQYKQYRHDPEVSHSLSSDRIWQINQTDPRHVWLATSKGLNRFNIENEQFEHFIPDFLSNLSGADNIIRAMLPSPDKQKILIGINRSLAILDIQKRQFTVLEIENGSLNLSFNHFSYSHDGQILLASIVGLFNTDTSALFANDGNAIKFKSIIDDADVRDILLTQNNLLWAASRHSGLIKLNTIDNPVTHINHFINNQGEKQLIGRIYTFFKDHQDTIWIGTRNHLVYLTKDAQLPKKIPLEHYFDRVSTIAQNPQGQLIVRDSLGTYQINKQLNQLTPFEFTTPLKRLNHQSINYLYSQKKTLWLVDDEFALYRVDTKGYSQTNIPRNESLRLLTDNMFNDNQQKLWIAFSNQQLWYQYDANIFDFKKIEQAVGQRPSINQITQDNQGKYYFASKEGLLVYNSKQQSFESPITIPNYNNEYISAIVDDQNNLWAANDDRILQLHADSDEKNIYGFLDGLNITRYQSGAVVKDHLGRLFFGGADGIDIIEPGKMKVNINKPKLLIGNIKVNNKNLQLDDFDHQQPLILESFQNDITFEFIAVELKQPRLNQYKFKLEGFDDNWSQASSNRFANYVNLPAGDYTIYYTGSNNSRVWSDEIRSFQFTIKQSFYNTVYFYGIVIIGLSAIFYCYAIYNARFHRRRRKFLQSQVNARTQDLLLLSNIGQKLSACLDDKSIFELLYKQLSERFGTEYFAIALYDKQNKRIQYQHVIEQGKLQPSFHVNVNSPHHLSSWCINKKKEIIIQSPKDISNYIKKREKNTSRNGYNSMLYLPLMAIDNQITGCLTIQSKKIHAYSYEQIDIARTLASYTAVALNNAQAYSQLEKQNQAIIDAQVQLVQSEKMASLGELTAGVAHEINNPINFVSVSCKIMSDELKTFQSYIDNLIEEDADQQIIDGFAERFSKLFLQLDTMTDGSQRIKNIVRDLSAFSRIEVVERQQVVLANAVQSTLHLIKTKFIDDVEFATHIDEKLAIEFNQSQFNQVLMNLIVNGCHAIIESERTKGTITITAYQQDTNVILIIEDNGSGMTEQTRQKVFEPFFTTKSVGKGTGLGLSISFGIINDHQGDIKVTSELGKGTSFIITIPLQQKPKD